MYTYPNPLNTKIETFFGKQVLIGKKADFETIPEQIAPSAEIERVDKFNNAFYYWLINEVESKSSNLTFITDIFSACKTRKEKTRNAVIPTIPLTP
jgi:hypothetical protein